jgi:ubiquinone/menaquinone biosynthesis C-methylase UbiE
MMSRLGWNSQGVDFDQNAVELARKNGLKVDVGTLESQNYPESSFDAVTINHVIEHVPDPVSLLKECRRILKPGGTIALATPNSQSLGHHIFKNNWRGLEPPRHLQILSAKATKTLFASAGFKQITVRTYNSLYVWEQSYQLSRSQSQLDREVKKSLSQKVIPILLTWYEQLFLLFAKSSGECIAAQGKK